MPVYRAKLAGRTKSILVRAESAAKGKDQLVELTALTGEEMADALDGGEKVWKPGDELPADETAKDEPEAEDQPDPETKTASVAKGGAAQIKADA